MTEDDTKTHFLENAILRRLFSTLQSGSSCIKNNSNNCKQRQGIAHKQRWNPQPLLFIYLNANRLLACLRGYTTHLYTCIPVWSMCLINDLRDWLVFLSVNFRLSYTKWSSHYSRCNVQLSLEWVKVNACFFLILSAHFTLRTLCVTLCNCLWWLGDNYSH